MGKLIKNFCHGFLNLVTPIYNDKSQLHKNEPEFSQTLSDVMGDVCEVNVTLLLNRFIAFLHEDYIRIQFRFFRADGIQ